MFTLRIHVDDTRDREGERKRTRSPTHGIVWHSETRNENANRVRREKKRAREMLLDNSMVTERVTITLSMTLALFYLSTFLSG